jgi:hypothetical protein
MDHEHLNPDQTHTELDQLADATARTIIEQQLGQIAADALAGQLNTEALRLAAHTAAERAIAQLTEPLPQLQFPTLPDWVEGWLLPVYRRSTNGHDHAWCPEWWRHAEAVSRLDALWRAWEHLRQDPATGISTWWRDHADYHLAILLAATGPLQGCTPQTHTNRPLEQLPHTPPPDGIFTANTEWSAGATPPSAPLGPMPAAGEETTGSGRVDPAADGRAPNERTRAQPTASVNGRVGR